MTLKKYDPYGIDQDKLYSNLKPSQTTKYSTSCQHKNIDEQWQKLRL